MAQDGKIISFNMDDLKIRELLTDPSGGPNTWGGFIDALGIQDFQISPEYTSVDLPGDGTILDKFTKLKKLTGSFTCQMVFAMMVVLIGGEFLASGSSPNEQGVFTISSDNLPKFFEFDAQSLYRGGSDASGGDFHIVVCKAKMTSFQYSMANEQYALMTVNWEAVPRLSDGVFGQFIENETRIDTAEGATDTTPPTVTATVPADADTGVVRTANLTATFSEDIQFDSGNFSLLQIVSLTSQVNEAIVCTYNSSTFVVTINPVGTLVATEDYTLIISGVRDKAGNMLVAPAVVNFVTAA